MRTSWTSERKTVSSCAAAIPTALRSRSPRRILVPIPFHPDLSVFKELFLPDWNQLFEAVDSIERGVERGSAMRGGDDDDDAGFADLHCAQPVDHADAADGASTCDFTPDFGHLADRHLLVAFVFQPQGFPATGIVTDHTLEGYTGPVTTL